MTNREERRRMVAIERDATKTRVVVARLETVAHMEMDAASVDFDRSYTIEVQDGGRLYRWTGAKAERRGDVAVFDYQDGKNGMMTEMSPSRAKIFQKP